MADTQSKSTADARVTLAETVAAKGVMIAQSTSTGTGYKASDAASRRVLGINQEIGVAADVITVIPGKYLLDNSATYPVTAAYRGQNVYVEDEETVSISAGSNSVVAGVCIDVVTEGVWVAVGIQ